MATLLQPNDEHSLTRLPDGTLFLRFDRDFESGDIIHLTAEEVSGSVCYGHDTAVGEDNTLDFSGNWTGTGKIVSSGDNERLDVGPGQYMELIGTWKLGAGKAKMLMDKYDTGTGGLSLEYKSGATESACEADTWHSYTGKFSQSGWVKIRVKE